MSPEKQLAGQRAVELGYMLVFAGMFMGSIGAYFLANSPNTAATVFSIVFIAVCLVVGLVGVRLMLDPPQAKKPGDEKDEQ